MIISEVHKYVFVEIPKNASQSISKCLVDHYSGLRYPSGGHCPIVPPEYKDYYIFACLRNPYSRAISTFHYILSQRGHKAHNAVKDMSFREYCKWVADFEMKPYVPEATVPKNARCIHRRGKEVNQSTFLDLTGRVNMLMRVEFLNKSFEQLPFYTGPLPQVINSTQHLSYTEVIADVELEEDIYRFAKPDFERFKYNRLRIL